MLIFQTFHLFTAKLLIVKFYLSIISVFYQNRYWSDIMIFLIFIRVIILCARVHIFGYSIITVVELLKTRCIKSEVELFPKAAQRIDLKCGLHEVNGLPVLMTWRFFEVIYEIQLTEYPNDT